MCKEDPTFKVKVNPETGLLDEPINPHKLPEMVAKKKPTTSITTAARMAGSTRPEIRMYSAHISTNITAMRPNTTLELM